MPVQITIGSDTIDATRIENDINGNPRFVVHFNDLETFEFRFMARSSMTLPERFTRVRKLANRFGGKTYRGKDIPGGIVFQAYECQLPGIIKKIRENENLNP